MSFRTTGADLESSKLTFACLSGFSLVRIEVTGLDQNFASVDVGAAVVIKGLSFRDVGYGLRAAIGSRVFLRLMILATLPRSGRGLTFWKIYLCGSGVALRHRRSLFVSW